jgi:hypothetical protein
MDLPAALHRAWQRAAALVLGPGVVVALMTLTRDLAITTVACTAAVPALLLAAQVSDGPPVTRQAVARWLPFPALAVLAGDGYRLLLGDWGAPLVAPVIALGVVLTWWASRPAVDDPTSWSARDDILLSGWSQRWRGGDETA